MAVIPPVEMPRDTQATRDLGLGRIVAQQMRGRFINRDGTVNTRKYGLVGQRWLHFYLRALQASWPHFLLWTFGLLLLTNGVFALAYLALGPAALADTATLGMNDPFLRAFFFSVAVFTTTGTGQMHAVGTTANWLMALESLAGVLALVFTGALLFARLTRPPVQIRFSQSGVIAPFEDGRGFMFRIVNTQPSEILHVEAQVSMSWYEEINGQRARRFYQLALERPLVELFTLHWTIVHPITAESPLHGVTREQMRDREAEFVVLVTGREEIFSRQVRARSSYLHDEIRWDAKFADMFVPSVDGVITIDVDRLDRMDRLPEGTTSRAAPKELVGQA